MSLDGFPSVIRLPLPPLISVESIKYLDANGVEQNLDMSNYRVVDNGDWPSSIEPEYGVSWPSTRAIRSSVTVRFKCGHKDVADSEVPEPIRTAMMMMVCERLKNREPNVVGMSVRELPDGVADILAPYRVHWFA